MVGAVLSLAVAGFAQSGPSVVDGFDPNVDGNVYAVMAQANGKIIVGGQFTSLRPGIGDSASRNNVARANPDGSVDTTFDPNANGPVRAIAVQADGKIIIAGDFTSVQPNGAPTASTRNGIARLSPDGTLDAAFAASFANSLTLASGSTIAIPFQVNAVLVQADGKIVVGGNFTSVGGVARNRIARLNANGTLDSAFNPNADNTIFALAQHTGGKILVAGGFTTFTTLQPNGAAVVTTRNRIARLNSDGTVDTAADPVTGNTFNPNANNRALALAVQRDGKILIGGDFISVQPAGLDTAVSRNHLVRLNADGSFDSSFNANASGSVVAVGVQPDGRLLVAGSFNTVWSNGGAVANIRYLARFNPDGTLDQDFNAGINNIVAAFAFQPDGQLVVGGYFTGVFSNGATNSILRNRLARLNPGDGALDATLNLDAGGRVLVSAVQSDGKILLGGSFTSIGGTTHTRMARLNADGSADNSFNPDFNERVFAIVPQAGGKILVGGAFSTVDGVARSRIARLNANGTLDAAFDPSASGEVGVIVVQPKDGKILLGGNFTTLLPNGATTAVTRFYIARVNDDGTVDTTFDPNANSTIAAISLQSDGKMLIGGAFTALQPNGTNVQVSRSHLARLNTDGTVDPTYDVALDSQVTAIAAQTDGKVVIAGSFGTIHPHGADRTYPRLRLARLNADGTLDTAFDPACNAPIFTLALQSGGKILVGGPFTSFTPNGAATATTRKYAARLNTDGTIDSTFDLDLNELNGNRVDSIILQSDGQILVAGTFTSLQPIGAATRSARNHFARITAVGALDTAFQPGVGASTSGQIKALAVQPDGKIVAAGVFADIGGTTTTNIARFNATGTADTGFEPTLSVNGPVNALLLRPDAAPSVVQGQGFAWLNANGTLNTAFNPAPTARISGTVDAVARQSDGSVIVGGIFTTPTGLPGSNLVRFTPAGVIDPNFAPNPTAGIGTIVVQPDGRILVAGSFTSIVGTSRNYLARLNSDGSLDATFNPNPSARVNAIVLQPDGKIIIGGAFVTVQPNTTTTAVTRNYVARLNADGTLDTTFDPNPSGTVTSLALQPDGQVIIGGAFTLITPAGTTTGVLRNRIARVTSVGALDTAFDPNFNDTVSTIVLAADGKVIVGGNFTTINPNTVTTTTTDTLGITTTTTSTVAKTRNYLVRLKTDGTLDDAFYPIPNSLVSVAAIQPADGKILIGGAFTAVQPSGASLTTTRNRLARLNTDGTLDTAFNPNANNSVNVVAVLPDGAIVVGGFFSSLQPNAALIIGGAFTSVGGVASQNVALLSNDGTANSAFQPNPDGAVNALLAQPDGKVVIGGAFTKFLGVPGSPTRTRLARFNADVNTTLDTTFNPAINDAVNAIALQPDGKLVIGGVFTTVGGQTRSTIARLNADGTLDPTFAATGFFGVSGIALQPDGRMLVVGTGSGAPSRVVRLNADGSLDPTFNAATGAPVAVIALQPDGKVVVGGAFAFATVAIFPNPVAPPSFLARLNSDGTFDTTFSAAPNGAVTALAIQADGRVVFGGSFSTAGGLPRAGLARLSVTMPAVQSISASRTTVVWTRSGGGPEFAGATFEQSADAQTWSRLGQGGRVTGTGNWQLSGLTLPASGIFYIRARGLVPASSGSSATTIELVRQFNLAAVAGVGPSDVTDSSGNPAGGTPSDSIGSVAALPKVSGAAVEVASNVYVAKNGNTYDQVLLTGTSATITADAGQITRLSFVDLSNDIVQVEFTGAGALSIFLDNATGPATAVNYNQPAVTYMKGHAGIVITGADETTNVSVFSVGRLNAVDATLFKADVNYDGVADIGYLTIQSANGKFGGIRTANASYIAIQGVAGIRATGVQFTGPVYIGDINAADSATPAILLGLASDVRITGGDLWQANNLPVQVSGIAQLNFTDGMTSGGVLLPAQVDKSRLEQNGADVTSQVVVNPSP